MEKNIILACKKLGLSEVLIKKTFRYHKDGINSLASCACESDDMCQKCKKIVLEIIFSENKDYVLKYKQPLYMDNIE